MVCMHACKLVQDSPGGIHTRSILLPTDSSLTKSSTPPAKGTCCTSVYGSPVSASSVLRLACLPCSAVCGSVAPARCAATAGTGPVAAAGLLPLLLETCSWGSNGVAGGQGRAMVLVDSLLPMALLVEGRGWVAEAGVAAAGFCRAGLWALALHRPPRCTLQHTRRNGEGDHVRSTLPGSAVLAQCSTIAGAIRRV
jgi:hypothetical protein